MTIPKPSEIMRTVCVADAAIDVAASKCDEFLRTRDVDLLTFHAGRRPTVYHLRPLDSLCVMRWVMTVPTEQEQRERAFRASVIRVEDWRDYRDGENADAFTGSLFEPRRYADAAADGRDDLFDLFTNAEMRRFSPAAVEEVGEVARWRAFFLPPTWLDFVLPPMCARTAAMRAYQRAEQELRTRAATGSGSAPPAV